MDTDFSLAILSSLHPSIPLETILDLLVKNDGDIERTKAALGSTTASSKKGEKRRHSHESSGDEGPSTPKRGKISRNLHSWLGLSKTPTTSHVKDAPPSPTKGLPPLNLPADAKQIAKSLSCLTLIPSVLPKELAGNLFLDMLDQNRGIDGDPWQKNKWWLFGRDVESPHTTKFYVRKTRDKWYSWNEASQYWYNGEKEMESKDFTNFMEEAAKIVEVEVNKVLKERQKFSMEWEGEWRPNVAAANCYKGSKESVGPHSDSLAYLGPYPTIASLTLGVERIFRLRTQVAKENASTARTYNVPLPHNSLAIMHAGCQENFKHSIPEMRAIDSFKLRGNSYTERINITFRFYRPDFAPCPSPKAPPSCKFKGTPKCKCGVPCTLRPDARGRALKNPKNIPAESGDDLEEDMLFFWQCYAGAAQNKSDGCGFFKILNMEEEGRGVWFDG